MDRNKFIICLVGQSGSGKSTIADKLKDNYGYRVIDSYTTRKPRWVGEGGHTFISEKEYDAFDKDEIMAYTYFNDNHYFTTKSQLDRDDVYVVDPDGVKYLKSKVMNSNLKIVTIHINVKDAERIIRMSVRGDSRVKIESRLVNDRKKFSDIEFDYSVCNNVDIDKAVKIIDYIIKKDIGSKIVFKKKFKNIFNRVFGKLK